MKSIILCLVFVLAYAGGQRITTIQLDGVQYFISRMNPYSPELNYFLAYQYCRSLGLQLASFETKEKVESMTEYLQNAGYGKYNFWTSGNRLGTGMFLWMSTGLPFNATFDYFEKSPETVGMDPLDHNSNTSPQRTARDSSGLQKGCVHLKAPSLRWAPEDCSAVKDFICEQTRCYYYNYGSIPVSSAQGRPIQTSTSTALYTTLAATTTTTTTSTTTEPTTSTSAEARQFVSFSTVSTAVPQLNAEHTSPLAALLSGDILEQDRTVRPSATQYANTAEEEHDEEQELDHDQEEDEQQLHGDELEEEDDETNVVGRSSSSANAVAEDEEEDEHEQDEHEHDESEADEDEQAAELHHQQALAAGQDTDAVVSTLPEDIPVEQKLKQITKEIEQLSGGGAGDRELRVDSRQSFLSLSDLIKNIRPAEKVVPQIDSSYANTMRVLGEPLSQKR
ncbi:PH domain-containing protein DDB_G0287875 isoform X2 [Anopheles stephensi]|uniref:PH domain-containing protein DDB_G0287875 isoform X2 n=2 Tax=Anopheles stephensi TaxID=30069 RepID=UPI0016587515|nr:PH domain-containing protein DDB_G0287875 isoform X2 [Anopheles stephensi]